MGRETDKRIPGSELRDMSVEELKALADRLRDLARHDSAKPQPSDG